MKPHLLISSPDRSLMDLPRTSESPVSHARPNSRRINEEGEHRPPEMIERPGGLPEIKYCPQTDRPEPIAYTLPGLNASQRK